MPRDEIDAVIAAAGLNPEWVFEGSGEMRPASWRGAIQVLEQAQASVKDLSLEGAEARLLSEFLTYVGLRDREKVLRLVRQLGYVLVPRHDVEAAAGDGRAVPVGADEVVDHLAFRPEWLREIGVPSNNVAVISVRGDSMADTLSDGDLVVVDMTPAVRKVPGVYVIARDDSLLIKRLHFKASGGVEIRSDNKSYPTETLSSADFEQVRIVGRMVRRLVR